MLALATDACRSKGRWLWSGREPTSTGKKSGGGSPEAGESPRQRAEPGVGRQGQSVIYRPFCSDIREKCSHGAHVLLAPGNSVIEGGFLATKGPPPPPDLESVAVPEGAAAVPRPLGDRELVLLVHRQMLTLAGPGPDLDDLVQTALEQLLRARFEGRSSFSTFTHGVCYRVWLKHLRFRYRFRARFSDYDTAPEAVDEHVSAESTLEQRERTARLYAALDRITPKRRAVLTLFEIAGTPTAEIARIVGAPEPTVRTRLRDARRQLEELLRQDSYFGRSQASESSELVSGEVPHGIE
jgi:RNA polymerase sigma-70 factor, ECF subfamily